MAELPTTTGVPLEWQISEIPDPTRSKAHGPKKHLNDPTRTFVCEVCSARFKRAEHLRRHRASRHAEPKEACPLCEYKAARGDNLKSHIRVVHGAAELNEFLAAKEDTETRATYFVELGLTTWRELNAAEGYPKDAFMTGSARKDNINDGQNDGQEHDQAAGNSSNAHGPSEESAALSGPIAHPRVAALGGTGSKRKRGDNSPSSTITPLPSSRWSHVTLPSPYPISFTSP